MKQDHGGRGVGGGGGGTPHALGDGRITGQEQAAVPVGEAMWRFITRASVVAVVFSLLVHVVWLAVLGVVRMPYGLASAEPGAGAGEVEVAIASEADLDRVMEGGVEAIAPSVPEMVGEDPAARDLMNPEIGEESASGLGELTEMGTVSGGGDVGGIGAGMGGGGGGGGGGASFFGVEARGSRFAFIVDVSGSMGEGGRLESLKRELSESIRGMFETAQFAVVAFSDKDYPLGGVAQWREASVGSKKWAMGEIEKLRPDGGTDPSSAFRVVLGMRPRPDAVYFMTDGQLQSEAEVEKQIAEMGKIVKIPIHCLCFSSKESEELMKRIAKESGGTYHYVP